MTEENKPGKISLQEAMKRMLAQKKQAQTHRCIEEVGQASIPQSLSVFIFNQTFPLLPKSLE